MAKKIIIAIGALLVLLILFAAVRSGDYYLERSIVINKPVPQVFKNVTDFKTWQSWSAWDSLDPNAKNEYSEMMHKVGAYHYWNGNDDIGEGKIEITELEENKKFTCKLTFIRPFESESMTSMILTETETGTEIKWTMEGTIPFPIGLFMAASSMDSQVGPDYEKGLTNLKAFVESQETMEENVATEEEGEKEKEME